MNPIKGDVAEGGNIRPGLLLHPSQGPQAPMRGKVFGIGLGKTGTTSLAIAMSLLGFRAKHAPRNLDEIAGCDFANDISVAWRFRFLDFVYPDAKFVLTVRDVPSWLSSCSSYARRREQAGPLRRLEHRFMCYGRTDFDEGAFTAAFQRHTEAVTEHFRGRRDKLLVMNICSGDGWETLCPFLGLTVLQSAFPHENKK